MMKKKKIQLRIRANTSVKKSFKEAWDKLTNWSKRCYLALEPPGKESQTPSSGFPDEFMLNAPDFEQANKGLKNFVCIKVSIYQIEWLFLASQGHRRALFEINKINDNFHIKKKWLIP